MCVHADQRKSDAVLKTGSSGAVTPLPSAAHSEEDGARCSQTVSCFRSEPRAPASWRPDSSSANGGRGTAVTAARTSGTRRGRKCHTPHPLQFLLEPAVLLGGPGPVLWGSCARQGPGTVPDPRCVRCGRSRQRRLQRRAADTAPPLLGVVWAAGQRLCCLKLPGVIWMSAAWEPQVNRLPWATPHFPPPGGRTVTGQCRGARAAMGRSS